ncbi:protein phosphatase 2C domain-containing protein [Calothrix sp. FACHB-1219]|uniref:4-Cys prefix domain-containing protein n=1 Tax=unclassified Calothrix TaxID=2619626 RepID=UPI001685124B|nr:MULTISPECIES: 4-Cys prefix domain-containing protein [unclassified Calothrix]MBD2206833.1 protein phosphatase 2C domain-containing protein [Calothrix sp. FACHB-168]MBD2219504.1 protein phosphatase 2C domain-containing protein [Calothrix sp. FACHB-1219]
MITTERIVYCINPDCTNPVNPLNNRVCANCQTALVHRYLWATGASAAKIAPGTTVANRYEVITHQIWLDTQPGLLPEIPTELPQAVIPYLRLYYERSHLPQAYGYVRAAEGSGDEILLLENVPIAENGKLYPAIANVWEQSTAVRQVYWLWQILQLWQPLLEQGVASSLLMSNNLRVQGWCVRLLELHQTTQSLSLKDLGESWQPLLNSAKTAIASGLQNIIKQMFTPEVEFETIANQLNTLLLSSAADLPLNLELAGATDAGIVMTRNEDACFPANSDDLKDPLIPHLSIVCDGIGGHQGGEVASQLAVQSIKLQVRALFSELTTQTELTTPDLWIDQLEASLRVVNNVICASNDSENRQGRERMATTLVMALQIPQRIPAKSTKGSATTHELYLASVGNSRAYWITPNYCQLLTVDDDVAAREVRHARNFYRQALMRSDATALTQALGTRDADALRVQIKRFILEEDGILLLCSDGLSDHDWVEQSWRNFALKVLNKQLDIEDAVQRWIKFANQKNGYDNTSIVMTLCNVSREYYVSLTYAQPQVEIIEIETPEDYSLEESSPVLIDLDITPEPELTPVQQPRRRKSLVIIGALLIVLGSATLGLLLWWQLQPQSFQQMCRQLPPGLQSLCSSNNE